MNTNFFFKEFCCKIKKRNAVVARGEVTSTEGLGLLFFFCFFSLWLGAATTCSLTDRDDLVGREMMLQETEGRRA